MFRSSYENLLSYVGPPALASQKFIDHPYEIAQLFGWLVTFMLGGGDYNKLELVSMQPRGFPKSKRSCNPKGLYTTVAIIPPSAWYVFRCRLRLTDAYCLGSSRKKLHCTAWLPERKDRHFGTSQFAEMQPFFQDQCRKICNLRHMGRGMIVRDGKPRNCFILKIKENQERHVWW